MHTVKRVAWLCAAAALAAQLAIAQPTPETAAASAAAGAGRFVMNPDNTVADRSTSLVWRRCSVGQRFDAGLGCVGLARKLWFAEAQRLEDRQWRLPTGRELRTLFDERLQTMIDPAAFPDAPATWYWARSPRGEAMAIGPSCGSGGNDSCYQADARAVRLVRRQPMQWPPK